jgi:hypothetical protein
MGQGRFFLYTDKPIADRNTIQVSVNQLKAEFTMLGPGEAKGFPAGDNVDKCRKCQARIEACICKK